MSISQNFPDLTPSLNLNFAGSKKLDPRVTFTRGSYSTYMDDNGLVKLSTTNQPRFDHSFNGSGVESLGLLIEESRTNLLVQSNSFTTSPWVSSAENPVYNQNVISPTGVSNSGWTIDDQSTTGDQSFFEQGISITPSTTTNYCFSIFAKQGTATYFDFYAFFVGNSVKGSYFRYNFSTDTISVSGADGGGITPTIYGKIQYPNGWYRLYFVVNDANNGLNNSLQYRIYPGSRDAGLTGTTLFYGSQIEIGAFPTSYIPTGVSQVTRSADVASITGTNFSSWYNPNEGSIFSSAIVNVPTTVSEQLNVFHLGLSNADGYGVFREFGTKRGWAHIRSGNTSLANFDSGQIWNQNVVFKSCFSFKTGDQAISYNGQTPIVATVSTTSISNINRLNLGSANAGSTSLNGTISQLIYYPKRLTNTELQNLTK